MIPVKLKMRNFMCYRDAPPLNFAGIRTACICGDNGNGKSALIDAITRALWGQARSKSDDDLIHATQNEMEVEFDFAVGRQVYRVIRKHARPKKRQQSGQSSLDLLVADNGDFKVISGDRIRDTGQKIRDILHMDYETFINSAFLRQGRADEFTRQPPTKRKDVLGNILGLSVYDDLEERAKQIAREREDLRQRLESAIGEIGDELVQKTGVLAQLAQVQGELSQIEKAITERQAEIDRLRREKESLEKKASQVTQLAEHMAGTEAELKRWEEQISQRQSRISEYRDLITRRDRIETGYAEFIQVKKRYGELDQKFRQVAGLNDYRHRLEMAIERGQAGLLSEHKLAQSKVTELDSRVQKLPRLKEEMQKIDLEKQRLATEEEALRREKDECRRLQTDVSRLGSTHTQLTREIAEIQEKLRILVSESGAVCPLCERELGEGGLSVIEKKFIADHDSKTDSLGVIQTDMAGRRTEMESRERDVAAREARLSQEMSRVQRSAGIASQQIDDAKEASVSLKEVEGLLREIEERLARKDFATGERLALAELEKELLQIDYRPEEHNDTGERLTELEPYEESKRRLDEADRLLAQDQDFISQAQSVKQELQANLEADRQRQLSLSMELESMPRVTGALAGAEDSQRAMVLRQKQVAEMLGNIRGKLQRCEELEEKKRLKENELGQTAREEQVYKELGQAFGKSGIQAMLIERAVPELEDEANRLLARMTDNRMHVKIETQREKKTGGVAETLDINISDEMGMRSYEMFSGGEAFRIDFAIRIALSRLLAHRAGAPLPTLIIDEGFGTQDSTGLEKIREAINSIQDDFEKILVITHIDDFKDAFPTRIDVLKTPDGSTLEVS